MQLHVLNSLNNKDLEKYHCNVKKVVSQKYVVIVVRQQYISCSTYIVLDILEFVNRFLFRVEFLRKNYL